jgi:hypothetical protein
VIRMRPAVNCRRRLSFVMPFKPATGPGPTALTPRRLRTRPGPSQMIPATDKAVTRTLRNGRAETW